MNEDEESMPLQKKCRMASPQTEVNELAVDAQSMLDREEQPIIPASRNCPSARIHFFDNFVPRTL